MAICTLKNFLVNIMKGQEVTGIANFCDMYPYVSGEVKPVERHTKRE